MEKNKGRKTSGGASLDYRVQTAQERVNLLVPGRQVESGVRRYGDGRLGHFLLFAATTTIVVVVVAAVVVVCGNHGAIEMVFFLFDTFS